jgi:hypothetical protein
MKQGNCGFWQPPGVPITEPELFITTQTAETSPGIHWFIMLTYKNVMENIFLLCFFSHYHTTKFLDTCIGAIILIYFTYRNAYKDVVCDSNICLKLNNVAQQTDGTFCTLAANNYLQADHHCQESRWN